MRIGSAGTQEFYDLLAAGGAERLRGRRAAEQRSSASGRAGLTQDEIKAARARGRPHRRPSSSSSTSSCSSPRTTPRTSDARRSPSTTSPTRSRTPAELLGLYGVESPTKQSIELCAHLVRATERQLDSCSRGSKGLRGSAERDPRDQADRGRGRPGRARRARLASSRTTASTR